MRVDIGIDSDIVAISLEHMLCSEHAHDVQFEHLDCGLHRRLPPGHPRPLPRAPAGLRFPPPSHTPFPTRTYQLLVHNEKTHKDDKRASRNPLWSGSKPPPTGSNFLLPLTPFFPHEHILTP